MIKTLTNNILKVTNIRNLEIVQQTDSLIITGISATFYCKQLASTAAMAAFPSLRIINDIQVK